jgi:Nucleoside phosphorylase
MSENNFENCNIKYSQIGNGNIMTNLEIEKSGLEIINADIEKTKPTIGVITALPEEYAAVNILLENKNDKYKIPGSGAGRRYCLGEILSEEGKKHSIVLEMIGMGNNIASTKASLLLEHFPNVKSIIMVGIAGGVPNPNKADDHIRLGDVVVSNEYGVIQYDNIKKETQKIIFRNPPRPPCASLLEAVKYLKAEELLGNRPWSKYIDQALSEFRSARPFEDKDILYSSDNQEKITQHPNDPKRVEGQPRIFIGPIASASILQKDPKTRDKLRDKFGVKAIEMEASGIADAAWNHEVGYLVVRGICDYCDSHKNDEWQQYAAIVAAAYTRALIESMA